jgi:hypothetical protein
MARDDHIVTPVGIAEGGHIFQTEPQGDCGGFALLTGTLEHPRGHVNTGHGVAQFRKEDGQRAGPAADI